MWPHHSVLKMNFMYSNLLSKVFQKLKIGENLPLVLRLLYIKEYILVLLFFSFWATCLNQEVQLI